MRSIAHMHVNGVSKMSTAVATITFVIAAQKINGSPKQKINQDSAAVINLLLRN